MRKSKFSESQIAAVLKEAEAGTSVADVCRQHGIGSATFYQWRPHAPVGRDGFVCFHAEAPT